MDQSSAFDFPQLPSYLRPYNHPTSYNYDFYPGLGRPSLSPPLSSSPEELEPPRKRFAPALPTSFCPPPHLFRPVDFDSPTANLHSFIPPPQARRKLPLTPRLTPTDSSSSEADRYSDRASSSRSASPAGTGGTQSIIGIDANYTCNGITASLLEADMWQSFNSVGNEMIVTKPGRRLFPTLLVSLSGLEPKKDYTISLRISPADQYRYKFLSMRWVAVGESEVLQDEDRQIYRHPNNPRSGAFWMKKPISFKPCKITHNSLSKNGNILLHTMHKYVMEIVMTPVDTDQKETTITLNATKFIAVTAYQNSKLSQLKIDNNPFAKGFRDRDVLPTYQHHTSVLPAYPPPHYTSHLPWQPGHPLPAHLPGHEMTPSASSTSPSPTFSHSPLPGIPDYSLPPFSYPLPSYPILPPHDNKRTMCSGYSADYSDED